MNETFASSLNAEFGSITIMGIEYSAARVLQAVAPAKYQRLREEFVAEQLARVSDDKTEEMDRQQFDMLEDLG